MIENSNGILLRITPSEYDASTGLTADRLATTLLEIYRLPYASAEELISAFHLPESLSVGTIFSNGDPSKRLFFLDDWKSYVVGFISKEDICVITFKTVPGSYFRPNNAWLDKGLYKSDGETLVSTGKKDPLAVQRHEEARKEEEKRNRPPMKLVLPTSVGQLKPMLQNPDPDYRAALLQQLRLHQELLTRDYFSVLERHYRAEDSPEVRMAIVAIIVLHPDKQHAAEFLKKMQRTETNAEVKEFLRQSIE